MSGPPNGDLAAVILVGGLGTRLQSVLAGQPKPMALINGRPFLEILVHQIALAGVRELVLCVGYRAEAIEEHFGDGKSFGLRIRYAREKELLGTAGAVLNALDQTESDPLFVLNGDSYCAADFSEFASCHFDRGAAATIVAVETLDCSRYGKLKLEGDGQVEGFMEKNQSSGPGWINAGIYLLQRAALKPLVAGRPASMERDVFPALVQQNSLRAIKTQGMFIDIGIPSELERAQTLFAKADFWPAR